MMAKERTIKSVILIGMYVTFFLSPKVGFSQKSDSILNTKISLRYQKSTIYSLLNQITDSLGYYFAYDSHVIKGDKKRRVSIDCMPLNEALFIILGDTSLSLKCIENHILIYKRNQPDDSSKVLNTSIISHSFRGRVLDSKTGQPLVNATVKVKNYPLGTISNKDGRFTLSIPDSIVENKLDIAHLGYKTKTIYKNIVAINCIDIYLDIAEVSIPEVIVRSIEPNDISKI